MELKQPMIIEYQSPYKGFNRRFYVDIMALHSEVYQSPYKGFNRENELYEEESEIWFVSLNPPIRGSIEQDNALFKDYNHKR